MVTPAMVVVVLDLCLTGRSDVSVFSSSQSVCNTTGTSGYCSNHACSFTLQGSGRGGGGALVSFVWHFYKIK